MNNKKDKIYNIIIKIIMFISSYFPLYIMVTILYFSKILEDLSKKNLLTISFIVLMTVLIIISIMSIFLLKNGDATREKIINTLENPDDAVLSYIMTYMIPLIANGDNSKEIYIVNIFLFVLIGYIYLKLNLIYLNPLWAMFGYITYRDMNKEIIITNISREELRHKYKLKGYYISNNVFVAHKKDNL